MKKLLISSLFVMNLFPAIAENIPHTENTNQQEWKYYIGADIGLFASDVRIKSDSFFDFGGVSNFAIGARYNRSRIEGAWQNRAEVSELFQTLAGHTVAMSNSSLRINGYYDYVSTKHFAMFIGAGVGLNRYDYTIKEPYIHRETSKHGFSFITSAKTGLSFSFWHISIDMGFGVDYITYPRVISYGPSIGLRYNF